MDGKPQRRTIVKALRQLATAVRHRDFLDTLSRDEYGSFNAILDATEKAERILERERQVSPSGFGGSETNESLNSRS